MEKISNKLKNGINALSMKSDDIYQFNTEGYDLVIITSSWDPRCLNLTKLEFENTEKSILLMFDNRDDNGVRDSNDSVIKSWASNNFSDVYPITGQSNDVDAVFTELFNQVLAICKVIKRPINILFDLSTCPRFLSLSLLSKGFDYGLIETLDFFYGECLYPNRSKGVIGENEVLFTSGEWNSKPVVNLLGDYQPGNKSRFIVSAGFEGNKTLRALNKEDPDSVLLLVPDPGFDDHYICRVMEANAELIKNEDIEDNSIIRSHAGDAIDVWDKLEFLSDNTEYNQKLFCAGSKPHSLGMALAALTDRRLALIYSQPQKHSPIEIEPINNYWLYSITSLTVPV